MKTCSSSLVISKMQIKSTRSHHYTPTTTAKIKKTNHVEVLWGRRETQFSNRAARNVTWPGHHGEKVWVGLTGPTTHLPFDLTIPLLGICQRQMKILFIREPPSQKGRPWAELGEEGWPAGRGKFQKVFSMGNVLHTCVPLSKLHSEDEHLSM